MPAWRGGDDHRAFFLQPKRGECFCLGFGEYGLFHHLAFAIEAVELGGDARGLDRVLFHQQARAEIGAADAPAGIDARAEQKAEMKRLRRAVETRGIHQRGQPDIVAPAHGEQAFGDEGAVEALERHHVGDGAERDEVERAEEIGLGRASATRSRGGAARG